MNRAARLAPWLFVASAIALVLSSFGGFLDGPGWRIGLAILGIGASAIGRFVHRMPWAFVGAVVIGGLGVVTIDTNRSEDRLDTSVVVNNLVSVVVGIGLAYVLAQALRRRRGSLDGRDLNDLVTVVVGSWLATWMLVTSRLISVDDVGPISAVSATLYLPLAALLFWFVIDLLFTGLRTNAAIRFIAVGAAGNLAASGATALSLVGLVDLGRQYEVALFGAAFLALCAGLAHPSVPDTIAPETTEQAHAAYTPLRLVLNGACLLVPGVLMASIAPVNRVDTIVRVCAVVVGVTSVLVRLVIAVRSHEAAREELASRLHLDELTNLPTRARFVTVVDEVLEATWRSEFQPTIIQLNLDRFKNINDSLGHYEANEVLALVGERISRAASGFGGTVARVGGDDFAVIDATTRSSHDAMQRLEVVRDALSTPVLIGESTIFVTASFGVAVAPRNRTLSAEELIRRADIATHRAKGAGRNSVAVFDDSMQAHLAHRMDVEHALHGAIGRQEMRLYHQPIVDITTGKVSGFESLMRWERDGVVVSPGEFITIAEDTGIIGELGEWALHEALGELRSWIDDGVVEKTTTISVNVSPKQIADPDFAQVVSGALTATGIPADLLWLEMTESMMLEEPELAESTLREIRQMGVRVALDDFGTGYSSLSLLQQFPIQRIKIDRAFVNGIGEPGNDRSLCRTIIAMAQSMGLDLVAEGVETVQQLNVLAELSCDKAQGFLISHPVPADAMRSTMVALDELASLSMFGPSTGSLDLDAAELEPAGVSVPIPFELARATSSSLSISGTSRPLGQPVY